MTLKQQIQEDVKAAMRSGDSDTTGVLRMLLSSILNKEKEGAAGTELSDQVVQGIVITEVKKRKEAKEAFEKGGRAELAAKEGAEAQILQRYLPEQLSDEELRTIIQKAISQAGLSNLQNIGTLMGVLMPQVKGRADGSRVSQIVKELLS